ncbi:hypothetical protein D3C84_413930 [compost metagenome]
MNTEGIREAVHRFISRLLEGREDFADNASLSQLGLDIAQWKWAGAMSQPHAAP